MERQKAPIKKPMMIMLIGVGVLFGGIFLYKFIVGILVQRFIANQSRAVTVSTATVKEEEWESIVTASASLRAIRGVDVTTELAGMVKTIYFTPGTKVTQGTILVQLRADADIAQLRALQANEDLARITYERDKAQFAARAVSKATVDADWANLQNLEAQVAEQEANVLKKTLRAPFSGRLGISLVNPGQWLNPGDRVVNLQTFDPIFADFYVPQQTLPRLRLGQVVNVTTDSFPKAVFTGRITTLSPAVNVSSRNLLVEATIKNTDERLVPGMFATAQVVVGDPQKYLTVPKTAVTFNPYGEVVFLVKKVPETKDKKAHLQVNQAFVITGPQRGSQVAIIKGLKKGDVIVTSGQLKLKNDTEIEINNSVQPPNESVSNVPNEH